MEETAAISAELIVRLASALVDDARAVQVEMQPLTKRVNFLVKVDINDHGKLVGRRGAHLKALKLIVKLMGQRHGESWELRALDPDESDREDRPQAKAPDTYDAHDALALLCDVLIQILEEKHEVGFVEDPRNTFIFTIKASVVQDYERLAVEQHEVVPEKGDPSDGDYRPAETMTLVAALGTFWYAYGRRDGVRFRVIVLGR